MSAEIYEPVELIPDTYGERGHPRNWGRSRIEDWHIHLPIEIVEAVLCPVREINNMETIVAPGTHFNSREFLGGVRVNIEIDSFNAIIRVDTIWG